MLSIVIKIFIMFIFPIQTLAWTPKTLNEPYDPKTVDWVSVISACKASCRAEKRICNFYIRAAAHDSLSISKNKRGGNDGSVILTFNEMMRLENSYDNFTFIISSNAMSIASLYDTSAADVVAVCGAVSTEFLGGPKIIKYDPKSPFKVGRRDKIVPNPSNNLAPSNMTTQEFAIFAKTRGVTIEELTALMGSHALVDAKGCLEKNNKDHCDPLISPCTNLSMFTWSNIYFNETCQPSIKIINTQRAVMGMPGFRDIPTFNVFLNSEMCKFTSHTFRNRQQQFFNLQRRGIVAVPPEILMFQDVRWTDPKLHYQKPWFYSVHDAWMGKACQGSLQPTSDNLRIQRAMKHYQNPNHWNPAYVSAYKKMMSIGVTWAFKDGFTINGYECPSGYHSSTAQQTVNCNLICNAKNATACPSYCLCKYQYKDTDVYPL